MVGKITTLTPEEEADIPRFRQRYLDLACDGRRADRETLQAALNDAYAIIGKPEPKLFIFDSPAACMLELKIFRLPPDKILWEQLNDQLWLREQLCEQLLRQLSVKLYEQLWEQLSDQLWVKLREQLCERLSVQLLHTKIYEADYLCGSQELYWIAWARFAEHIGVKLKEDTANCLDIMERIATQCEWWWPYEGIVVASERPLSVRWDEQRRLHCEDGPAVAYADGYRLYAWHGTVLPERWVLERATIDPSEIFVAGQMSSAE